jgi:hypothetical protein
VGFAGLSPVGRQCVTHAQLIAAVFRAYPEQRTLILGILGTYDWRLVRSVLKDELEGLCSPQRVDLILTCLRRRVKAIYRALHGHGTWTDILRGGTNETSQAPPTRIL